MPKKVNLNDLKEQFLKEGAEVGFILTGIEYYNSSKDSRVEFYCVKDKKYVTRPWDTWKRCFGHNNTKFRPVCCYERETGTIMKDDRSENVVNNFSIFPGVQIILPAAAQFSQEQKVQIASKLSKPSLKVEPIVVPEGEAERTAFIERHASRLNATVVKTEGLKTKSKIFLRCNTCNVENQGTMLKKRNMAVVKKMRCCENRSRKVGMSSLFVEKMHTRGHQIIGADPQSRCSPIKIYCIKHDVVFNTSRDSYERGVTGLPCCGNEKQVKSREGRVSTAAPPRKGHTQWRNNVLKYGSVCFITGRGQSVQAHHLFSAVGYPKLASNPLNGIALDATLHRKFHAWHGQNDPCTVDNLCDFLLLVSDAKNTEGKVFFDSIANFPLENLELKLQELKTLGKTLTELLAK